MTSDSRTGPTSTPAALEAAAVKFLRAKTGDGFATGEVAGEDSGSEAEKAGLEKAWSALARHGASPELMALRNQALARVRAATAESAAYRRSGYFSRRTLVAASFAGAAVIAFASWQAFRDDSRVFSYRTDVGEQHVVELEDRSRIALDAQTELVVEFSRDSRVVRLNGGQAYFTVAKDPRRPFRVEMGGHAVIALGTEFNVEYVDRQLRITMLEGRVAVSAAPASPTGTAGGDAGSGVGIPDELLAGQELRIDREGHAIFNPAANTQAAASWRQGSIIFTSELLADAVARLNRYSRVQLKIRDPQLAALKVSGVFEVGDVRAFTEAIESYLPVVADYSEPGVVNLLPAKIAKPIR